MGGETGLHTIVPCAGSTPRSSTALIGWLWAAVVAYASLLPFDFRHPPVPHRALGIFDIRVLPTNADDVRTNILVYAPVGWLIVRALRRRGRTAVGALGRAVLLGGALSVTLEGLQTCTASRIGSWLDVGLNLAGSLFGGMASLCPEGPTRKALAQARREIHEHPMRLAAALLTVGLFVYGLAPFDFVTTTAELHASFARASWRVPSAGTAGQGASAVVGQISGALWFAGLAYVIALAGLEAGRHPTTALGSAMKHGVLLAALVEGMQLFTCSHVCEARTLYLRIVAVALGAWSGVFVTERPAGEQARSHQQRTPAPTSVLALLIVVQVGLLLVPPFAASFTSAAAGDASTVSMPLEIFWRAPASSAFGALTAMLFAFGSLACTLTVVVSRAGLRHSGAVAAALTLLAAAGSSWTAHAGSLEPTPLLVAIPSAWLGTQVARLLSSIAAPLPHPASTAAIRLGARPGDFADDRHR